MNVMQFFLFLCVLDDFWGIWDSGESVIKVGGTRGNAVPPKS